MKNSMTIPMTYSGSKESVNRPIKLYNNLLAEFKKQQTGYTALAIIGQSCIGSVAVMLLLMNELPMVLKMGLVFLVTILCMGFNATVLAQLKSKTVFNTLIVSVVFSSIIIISHLY
ncbi:hypothetical protein OO009_03340 [Flavobacteriaceae bacterium KMM 6897]|nr:hypothetical protein [Flavobacteriaceae bacterium KMM 6897]MEB8346158.1 hypothetical protein [Flavobacteriaceae bacterium KMM 6898]